MVKCGTEAGRLLLVLEPRREKNGDPMDEGKIRELVEQMSFPTGKNRDMSIDEIAIIQPGLGRIMPEIGARTWKLYYAGKAENWANAMYQFKEGK